MPAFTVASHRVGILHSTIQGWYNTMGGSNDIYLSELLAINGDPVYRHYWLNRGQAMDDCQETGRALIAANFDVARWNLRRIRFPVSYAQFVNILNFHAGIGVNHNTPVRVPLSGPIENTGVFTDTITVSD